MRKGYLIFPLLFLLTGYFSRAQTLSRPKLVVGIVVDQMRRDYLYWHYDRYGAGGFKRLLTEGYSCEDTMINHLPSYTAVGHSTIFTGSVPAIHGITGNNRIDQESGTNWYRTGGIRRCGGGDGHNEYGEKLWLV